LSLDDAIRLRYATSAPSGGARIPAFEALLALRSRIEERLQGSYDLSQLVWGERLILRVIEFDMEAQNGGVDQYLSNSSGDHAEEMKAMLRVIGADQALTALETLCACLPGGIAPTNREERNALMNAAMEADEGSYVVAMNEATDQYLAGHRELYDRTLDYVEAHRTEFA
jgi:hypothetical protein